MQTIPKLLLRRINRLAHQQALEHEQHIKLELTQRLQQARTDGASVDALSQLLDGLETDGTESRSMLRTEIARLQKRMLILIKGETA